MDYKPSNSSAEQENISTLPPMTNDSSKARVKIAYISIGAILLLVVAGIVTWYFIISTTNNSQQLSAVVKTTLPALTDGNTNADITNDINKIPSDSSAFAKDQSSINNSINGL